MSSGGMDDQLDQLRQMREASQRIREQAQRTSDAMSSQIQQMRDMVRNNSDLQSDQFVDWRRRMKLQTKAMKQYYRQNSRNLTREDKQAYKVMYKNRRRDLRDLEREARYRFRDIEEEGMDAFENIGNKISEISESLRDWATALNVDSLVNGLGDAAQSIYESKKELQKMTGLSKGDMQALSDSYRQSSKDSGYIVSANDYMQTATQLAEMGYKDIEFLKDFGTSITNMSAVVAGIDVSNLEKFTEFADKYGTDQAIMYEQLATAVNNNQDLYSSGADMMKQFEDTYADVLYKSGGDLDKFNQMMQSRWEQYSLLNDNWLGDQADSINDMFNRLSDLTDTDNLQNLYALAGTSANQIRDEALSGDYAKATEDLILAIKQNFSNGNADTMASALGIDKEQMQTIVGQMYNVTAESLAENRANFQKSVEASMTTNPIELALKEAYISPLDKLKNWLNDSALGSAVDEFISSTGMSLTDLAVAGNIFGKGLKGIGKLASKIFGGGGGAGGAGGGTGGAGLLSSIGNFFRAGFGGAGADTAAGAAGMNILGFGAPGGMATLGTGGAMSAGLLATSAMGAGGLAWMGVDAYKGTKKANEWLGRDDTSAKVISGVGGALGGTGPGWADEGSIGDKAKNTLAGAGKGALIGGAIGSIVPGLGTAIGAAIGGGVGAIASAIGGEKISQAIDWVGEKAGQMWDGVKSVASSAWEGIKGFGSKAWDGIKGFASSAWEKTKNFGIDAFNTAVGVGDMAMDGLFNAIGLDWDETKQKISDGWSSIKDWASEKWTGIKDWASEKWSDISGKASEVWDGVTTKASEVWDGVSTKASEIWGGITDVASGVWDTVSEYGKSALQGVGDFFGGIWDGIKDKVSQAKDWVGDKVEGAKDWVSDKWNGVKNFFSGAKDRGENITGISGSHKNGLDTVPYDGYIAELHKGETVLTKEQAQAWKKGLMNKAGSIVSNVQGLFSGDSESKIINFATNIYDKGSEAVNNFKEYMHDKMDDIKDTGNQVFDIWTDDSTSLWEKTKKTGTLAMNNIQKSGNTVFSSFNMTLTKLFGGNSLIGKFVDKLSGIGSTFTSKLSSLRSIFGGSGVSIDGSHKNGLDYVPKDGYVAELHKGESVLTAQQADVYRNNQNTSSVKSWFSGIMKQVAPTLQKPTISTGGGTGSGTDPSGSGSVEGASSATLSGSENAEKIWKYLRGKGFTKEGTAGLMGNLYAESGLSPINLQNSFESRLGSDSEYTAKVDNGSYTNFGGDSAGYGLAQWTYSSRKKNLLNYAKSAGSSIGDLGMQLNFLHKELSESYSGVYNAIKSASSLQTASNKVLHDFESPANQSASVEAKRASYGQGYYNKYNAYEQGTPWVPNTQVALLHKGEAVIPAEVNPMNGGTKAELSSGSSSSSMDEGDVKEIVNVIKWMVGRLEKKLDETSSKSEGDTTNNIYANRTDRVRKSDSVFSF